MTFQFESLNDFMTMSGHGGYVWFCYAVTFLTFAGLTIVSRMRLLRLKRQVKAIEARSIS